MKVVALWVGILAPSLAWAGGFEFPDNTAEALGRGAAFTAKADDGAAVEYNLAGFARQRGTNLLLSANLVWLDSEFQRSGVYPDAPSVAPYGGQPFPKVSNDGPTFFAPFLSASTDFGLDRWTFALAVFGPSAYGKRSFAGTVGTLPGPARYDMVSQDLFIAYPTLAAAVRATKWLDIGLALHMVVGNFKFSASSLVYMGRIQCPNGEFAPCDSFTKFDLTGVSATAALGLMFHPLETLSIGVNVRGKIHIDATGDATGIPPAINSALPIDTQPASMHTDLPWVVRLGLRYAFMKDGFEHGDVEVDGVYEAWADAQGTGITFEIPTLSIANNITALVLHNYRDTYSVRVGGAYNLRVGSGVINFRLGFFFDSAATHFADTRVDFDTMAKYAPTVGLGFKVRGIGINAAYAYLWSPDRDVTNGEIRVINALNHGATMTQFGDLPVVNNGHYHASTQVFSLSATFAFDEVLGHKRVSRY
jgi:long-subunit fatty acid transport protein